MRSICVYQPCYFPQLHYFNRICNADVFVSLDNAQFVRKGSQPRTPIKTGQGKLVLTVPSVHHGERRTIADQEVDYESKWVEKHLRAIELSYRRAPFFDRYYPAIQDLLQAAEGCRWRFGILADATIRLGLVWLGLKNPSVIRWGRDTQAAGKASEWMLNLSLEANADRYLSGRVAYEEYMDVEAFAAAGVEIVVQDWEAPLYPQLHGPFLPNLSIIDLVMNVGPESGEYIAGGDWVGSTGR